MSIRKSESHPGLSQRVDYNSNAEQAEDDVHDPVTNMRFYKPIGIVLSVFVLLRSIPVTVECLDLTSSAQGRLDPV